MNEVMFWLTVINIFICGFYFGSMYGKKNEK